MDVKTEIARLVSGVCSNIYIWNADGELETLQSLTALDSEIILEDVLDADVINGN